MKKKKKIIISSLLVGAFGVIFTGAYFAFVMTPAYVQDQNCTTTTQVADGPTSKSQEAIAKYEFDFFKSKGMDDAHAAALVGYSDYESGGLVPAAKQYGNQSASETGWGLFQVTPIDRLKNFAKKQGVDWTGEKVQLEYAWTELHHAVDSSGNVTSGGADWIDLYHHGVSLAQWWKLTDVSEIAGIYTDCFGRGAKSHDFYNDGHEQRARKWYAKFAGSSGNTSGSTVIDESDTSSTEDGSGSTLCGTDNSSDSSGSLSTNGNKMSYFDDLTPYLTKWLGKSPYNYGGAPTNLDNKTTATTLGTDCSGFVGWAFGKIGIHLTGRPTTTTLFDSDVTVENEKDAKAGDLVFFEGKTNPGHVGVYIGNGLMIDDQDSGIKKEKVHASWWPDLQFARLKSSFVPSKYK
ncbi:phage tail tip lysozyme [Lentilactobacillus hilgardii]|uniref:phage tail tip lysozyme n=1 Tax=Lentilactobacillus hilgardii TaxID=1588 RepID=UPI00390C7106